MSTVLLTGASSGLGLEFARRYAARGWKVIATCRAPEAAAELGALATTQAGVAIHRLDVAVPEHARHLAALLAGAPIDVLLHNAGYFGGTVVQQSFGSLDFPLGREVMETNLWGVLRVTEALVENVAASDQRKIIAISSSFGSLSTAAAGKAGGGYFYRMSKAALNMAMIALAKDLAPRGITTGLLSPGVVKTRFGAGAGVGPNPLAISATESVAAMMPLIDKFSLERSGTYLRYSGEKVEW